MSGVKRGVPVSVAALGFSYGGQEVLRDVSFTAPEGSLLAVLGPNGVGKTTLFRCILGFERRYTGSIEVNGLEARALGAAELAGKIAYIPQARSRSFGFTVRETVMMGAAHGLFVFAQPGERERGLAKAAMERMGIMHIADKDYNKLSGGEQQLTLIARALAQDAGILIMDEPTASLDYGNTALVLSFARSLAASGYTVIMSTHDPQQALWYADCVLALENGRVAALGAPGDVIDEALLYKLYGVRARILDTDEGPLICPDMRAQGRRS